MSNDENLHKGHRQRLLKKYLESGFQSLEEHEVLEVLLFFALSRCNTNEISHKLINKFGSAAQVLNAPISEITQVKGVGETSAVLMRFLGDFVANYGANREAAVRLESLDNVIKFCEECFPDNDKESCHFLMLDKRKYLIACLSMTGCEFSSVNVDLKAVLMKAFNINAKSIIIVHNHPYGPSIASNSDVKFTRDIAETLISLNINVCDHIIIGNDGYFSMRRSSLLGDIWR